MKASLWRMEHHREARRAQRNTGRLWTLCGTPCPLCPCGESIWNCASPIYEKEGDRMLYVTLGLEILIMLALPVTLWLLVRRRPGVTWGLIGAGVLTFIASQVVHLPLNWALGLLGGGRGVALWPAGWIALVAGLSAGVCEELARYLVLRFWRREARSWAQG
ncbi:MAG TPA: YhfC family intramembrane metalloprotease, partial [Anaerolineales bacterium]|nr:YhfC family intramembrane metalloprotease [Anaerolineales bacterium]